MNKIGAMRVVFLTTALLLPLAETCPERCTCPSFSKVICYNTSLTSVPQDLYNEDIITLDLSYNVITELEHDSFSTHRLRYLFLNNNCIRSVSKTTFWTLTDLHNLFLNNNQITHIDHLTFLYNNKLKELDLSGNQLTSLNDSTFVYVTSLKILNISGNRLTSLHFVVPMTTDQSVSKQLTLDVASNKLKNLDKDTLRALGRFKAFDISNNTALLCPCQRHHHSCLEYTQNWNEYVVLCLQTEDPSDVYRHVTTKTSFTKATTENKETTTFKPTTKRPMRIANTEGRAAERATMASLSKLELTVVIITLSAVLVIILAVTVAYFMLRSRLQNNEDLPSQIRNDLKDGTHGDDGSCGRRTSYADVDDGLKRNLLPFRLHLVTPVELNEPLYQAESVGSFIYTPPSEVYFDYSTASASARQLPPRDFYSQGRVILERGYSMDGRSIYTPPSEVCFDFSTSASVKQIPSRDLYPQGRVTLERENSMDGRSIYDPGIYNYDHIYEEIK